MADLIEGYSSEEVAKLVESVLSSSDRELLSYGDATILRSVVQLVYENLGPQDYAIFLRDLKKAVFDHDPRSDAKQDLRTLHTFVSACRLCEDVVEDPQMPFWNLEDPDVLIVGSTPLRPGSDGASFLIQCMKEAGLSSSTVASTSVARCFPSKGKPSVNSLSNCSARFLFKEILYLNPKVIITLGSAPFASLLATQDKITESVGEWRYLGPWAIMPTYEPSYALRSENNSQSFQQHILMAKKKAIPS